MPKKAIGPRHVGLLPIKRGDKVMLPAFFGDTYVKERAPEHGLYITLGTRTEGVYVTARALWDALDLVIDIEDRE